MTKRTIIVATVLVCLSLWSAYSLDSFGTMVLSLPGLFFFLALAINMIIKAVKLKSLKELKPIFLIIIGVGLLFTALKLSDHGLAKLTKERELMMTELRPVIINYRQEKGVYPEKLELLVPRYIKEIPEVLRATSEKEDPYKRLTYEIEIGKPVFRYRVVRGPDSGAKFDIESGKFTRDM